MVDISHVSKQSTQKQVESGRRIRFSICISHFNNKPRDVWSADLDHHPQKGYQELHSWGFRASFHV